MRLFAEIVEASTFDSANSILNRHFNSLFVISIRQNFLEPRYFNFNCAKYGCSGFTISSLRNG